MLCASAQWATDPSSKNCFCTLKISPGGSLSSQSQQNAIPSEVCMPCSIRISVFTNCVTFVGNHTTSMQPTYSAALQNDEHSALCVSFNNHYDGVVQMLLRQQGIRLHVRVAMRFGNLFRFTTFSASFRSNRPFRFHGFFVYFMFSLSLSNFLYGSPFDYTLLPSCSRSVHFLAHTEKKFIRISNAIPHLTHLSAECWATHRQSDTYSSK